MVIVTERQNAQLPAKIAADISASYAYIFRFTVRQMSVSFHEINCCVINTSYIGGRPEEILLFSSPIAGGNQA